ncbi:MAG: hypothetical protein WCR56_01390 [Bacilli bacterium]|jgi:tRNA nucleotidyltransferase (CCA-adding enzyme)
MKIALKSQFLDAFNLISKKLGKQNIYLVGGFARDTLLGRDTQDMDFATPLSPQIVYASFPYALYFPKYGTVSFNLGGIKVTIATFRRENDYKDHRHPNQVVFVKSLYEDYKRRDFTINSLYVNSDFEVIDPTRKGLRDLTKKRLCLIGNNCRRLREDPLRILRAYRFSFELDFTFSHRLSWAIAKEKDHIKELLPQKIKEEVNKCPISTRKKLVESLNLSL